MATTSTAASLTQCKVRLRYMLYHADVRMIGQHRSPDEVFPLLSDHMDTVKECVSLEGQVARTFGAMCEHVAKYVQGSPSRKYHISRG